MKNIILFCIVQLLFSASAQAVTRNCDFKVTGSYTTESQYQTPRVYTTSWNIRGSVSGKSPVADQARLKALDEILKRYETWFKNDVPKIFAITRATAKLEVSNTSGDKWCRGVAEGGFVKGGKPVWVLTYYGPDH